SAAKLLQKTQLSPKVSLLSRACLVILTDALNKTDQNRAFLYAGVGKTSTVMAVKVGGFAWFDSKLSQSVLFAMASDCLFFVTVFSLIFDLGNKKRASFGSLF
ncbi:MAG: hypothetical protein SPI56_00115, partial [Alloprevotella sp.]|nr:hypothetical protein [Alloprevotella sp.]